jgi:hypothetical protein
VSGGWALVSGLGEQAHYHQDGQYITACGRDLPPRGEPLSVLHILTGSAERCPVCARVLASEEGTTKRRLKTFDERFREAMEDPRLRDAYIEVTREEARELLLENAELADALKEAIGELRTAFRPKAVALAGQMVLERRAARYRTPSEGEVEP